MRETQTHMRQWNRPFDTILVMTTMLFQHTKSHPKSRAVWIRYFKRRVQTDQQQWSQRASATSSSSSDGDGSDSNACKGGARAKMSTALTFWNKLLNKRSIISLLSKIKQYHRRVIIIICLKSKRLFRLSWLPLPMPACHCCGCRCRWCIKWTYIKQQQQKINQHATLCNCEIWFLELTCVCVSSSAGLSSRRAWSTRGEQIHAFAHHVHRLSVTWSHRRRGPLNHARHEVMAIAEASFTKNWCNFADLTQLVSTPALIYERGWASRGYRGSDVYFNFREITQLGSGEGFRGK